MNDLARELRLSGVPSVLAYPWQRGPLQWVFGHAPKRLKLEVPLPPEGAATAGAVQAPELACELDPDTGRGLVGGPKENSCLSGHGCYSPWPHPGEAVLLRNDENMKKSFRILLLLKLRGPW